MSTEENTEDTLTVRSEQITGYVKLVSLNVGDEFETESTGGKVAWVIRNGHAQAVGVVFDGHTTDISIAPTMLVKVRKYATVPAVVVTEEETTEETEQATSEYAEYVSARVHVPEEEDYYRLRPRMCSRNEPSIRATPVDVLAAEEALFDDAAFVPPVVVPNAVALAPPTIRIIQIAGPATVPKAVASATLPVCSFDLTLNEEQINLLHFSSATDLFCRGLHFSWTKPTFFAVAKKHFPGLKCGQDYEACMRQIALYRATLRKAGKLG